MGYASSRALVVASFLFVLLRRSVAFVVPGGGRAINVQNTASSSDHEHRARSARRWQQVLFLAPRAQAETGEAAQGPVGVDGGELSGREAVEQAGERLVPLFAQVDAHTQRWVLGLDVQHVHRPANQRYTSTGQQGRGCRELTIALLTDVGNMDLLDMLSVRTRL